MLCPELEFELENLSGTGYDNYPISPASGYFPE